MKTISDRLWKAVIEVSKMRHPSVAEILRKRRFGYEADRVDELIGAFDEMQTMSARPDGDGGELHSI